MGASPADKKNPKLSTAKRASFSLILLSLPVLFFLLLELALRLFGYGFDTEQWVSVTDDKLMLNPDIARRYFYTIQTLPISNQDTFDKEKKPNSFRVFVLGESSGAGFPYTPIGSFSRWLQKRLEILYPACTIEVVNLSMTAVNSYTIRDLFAGVIEKKPDAVLLYAGHNEYYGALGVGSTETFGSNPTLVRMTLFLNRLKTVELLRNTLAVVSNWFSGSPEPQDGTLMSRMAKDQYIELDSEEFRIGLVQYEENIRDILESARAYEVPVILGTLTNNLKHQKPFISQGSGTHPPAGVVFENAGKELRRKNYHTADSLFRLAKDLDLLRFRSSEEMNRLIARLGSEFGSPVVQVDSVFNALSPGGIVGDNLMTDHLHPTIQGYRIMSQLFYNAMREHRILPRCDSLRITERELDSMATRAFAFTRLDSVIAAYRILVLKNDWPYIEKKDQKRLSVLLHPSNFIDSAAFEFIKDGGSWESAQRKAAGWYLLKRDHTSFMKQMDVLISQFPIVVEYYDFVANELLKVEKYDEALKYLTRRYTIKPDAYSSKWLGIISLSRSQIVPAVRYLEESLRLDATDAQVWYNLTGAYSYNKEYDKARNAINRCLGIDPAFPKAADLKRQLERVVVQ